MRWTGRNSSCCYKNRWQVLCEYDDAGTPQRWFAYGNYVDEVLIMSVNASPIYSYFKYYVHDHLYSPVVLTNSAGSVEERYEYDAYGNCYVLEPNFADDPDGKSDYGNPYYFTGRRLDGLDGGNLKIMYYRRRWYDAFTGRFLTHDPLGYGSGMSLYEPFNSNPVKNPDPTGLQWFL